MNRLRQQVSRLIVAGLLSIGSMSLVASDSASDSPSGRAAVVGLWSGGDSLLEVKPTADDSLSMVVLALQNPRYLPDEGKGQPGQTRLDDNNPQPALRQRPILGLELLSEYRFDGRRWQGSIYDPESGNSYSSRMERDGARLKMRGYIGVPMLGRTQYFQRVERCDETVLTMLTESEVDDAFCD